MNRKILTILITLFLFPILTVFAFVNPYNIPCKNSLPGFVQSNAVIGQVPTKQSNGLWAPAIPGNMNTSVWDADTNGAIDAAAGGTNKILWTLYSIPFLSGTTIFDQIPIGTAGQYLQVNAGANGYTWGSGGSPAFNAITTGTNTTAAMTCGTGCSIVPSGTGDVTATSLLAAYIDWNGTDGASILNKPSLLPVPASPTSGSLYQYITSAWDKSAFTFPTSITAGDLFYGSSANVIGAIAKGGNNSVFGINGFGVQGYLTQFASDDSAYNFFNVTDITKRGQFNLSALSASTTITVDWPTVAGTMCDTGAVCTVVIKRL